MAADSLSPRPPVSSPELPKGDLFPLPLNMGGPGAAELVESLEVAGCRSGSKA